MLTNKKIIVSIIMLSLFMTSCGDIQEGNKKDIIKNNENIKVISGKKNKAFGGETLEKGIKTISISDGIDTDASQKPDFIK